MSAVAESASPLARLRAALPGLPGGSGWAEWRAAALERLIALGLPGARDEAWKYTNLRLLERLELAPAAPTPVAVDALRAALPPHEGARYVFVDGRYAPSLSQPAGGTVRCELLADLLRSGSPESLADVLPLPGDVVDERVRLWNAALLADGLRIVVPPGAHGGEIINVVHVATGGGAYARLIVDAGAQAACVLVEHRVSLGTADSFAAPVTDIRLEPAAVLEHYRLGFAGPRAVVLDDVQVGLARDARYVQHHHLQGGRLARADVRISLREPGADATIHGLFMVDGARQLDTRTLIEHAAPHTQSRQVFRGVAGGRGRGTYDGKIVVRPGAIRSESQQSSRNLLLSPTAEIDARPQLEILTDDVKCGHGATTGALDEHMLFYLLSRGIDRDTARGLLTFAFAEDVVARVRIAPLRRWLEQRVLGGLPDADLIREFV